MHTVGLLAQAIKLAGQLGYTVRQEWIDCDTGGGCELRGRKYLFINLATTPSEQLETVLGVLRGELGESSDAILEQLRAAVDHRKIA